MKKKDHIELLSPVGSFESLQAAIKAGADAIYFGVEQLNMRTKSSNALTLNDIREVSILCRKHNIKSYLTLNTVVYEHDIQLLKVILKEVKKNKIDAVIGSDFAVIDQCSQMNIPLHISTQANVSNLQAVQFFSRFSDVIVLARELTLKQVEKISKEIKRKKITGPSGDPVRIEIFIHGALCMAISGKCYLSLHSHNSSANRGACVQNCRRQYTVIDNETQEELLIDNEYIMSPKDLCTIDFLDQILASGAQVLKIEGRGKSADYVYTVTKCYREAIDAIQSKSYTADKILMWKTELAKVYNRGFWEGYYLGRKLGEWTANPGSAATEKKVYIAKGTKYYPRIKVGEFLIESGTLHKGDTIMIIGKNCGMEKIILEPLFVNGKESKSAKKGDKITLPLQHKVLTSDKLYKITEELTTPQTDTTNIMCFW